MKIRTKIHARHCAFSGDKAKTTLVLVPENSNDPKYRIVVELPLADSTMEYKPGTIIEVTLEKKEP